MLGLEQKKFMYGVVSIRRGRPWGFSDASFGTGISRLAAVSIRYSSGHSGGASVAYAYPYSSMGLG